MEEVVNDGMPIQEEPTPQEEQPTIDSEVVENPVSDVNANLRRALQKERDRRKQAEAQLRNVQVEPVEEDDAVRRFTNVEATTLINNKLLLDPSFKERLDLVKYEMESTGKTIEDADNAVLARLFREMTLGQVSEERPATLINQLPKKATPEGKRIPDEVQAELDQFDEMAKSFGG